MTANLLAELMNELAQATADYQAASDATSRARSDETNALNRVCKLQERIDALLAEARKNAPENTDWRRKFA